MASVSPPETRTAPEREASRAQERLWRFGRSAWAVIGVVAVLVVAAFVVQFFSVVIIALVLALFPATLLVPVSNLLKRIKVPDALAAILSILAGLLLIGGVIGGMVPLVIEEAPRLAEAAGEGLDELEGLLPLIPFTDQITQFSDLIDMASEQLPEGNGAEQVAEVAGGAVRAVTGVLLAIVALFFYLKDGRRLTEGVLGLLPQRVLGRARDLAERAWGTLAAYFRGQLLVAFVDALFIGLGLVLLGVPLALPLAVLIFFGGLFPVVGAVLTGALAVLVALADGGLTQALIVLGIVIGVQQLESNLLQPFILGRIIHLHPLVVLLSITVGALAQGVLGAFIAVPIAAIIARSIEYLREEGGGETESDPQAQTARNL